ncbi:hypothetical protein BPOR_0604g00050 [Botrytis porri]|uniref:Uncharacterized protein n=1 Tax=Botrytis porri TaxID=87229 RepID=A0A4Z1KC84_9HELO|nr:hypothetical protein BPOR_0604g00050 [Botrytis porri]
MTIFSSLLTCAFCCKFNLSKRSLGPRPSDSHSLAFYFPVDLDPRLEWVQRPDSLHSKTNDKEFDFRSLDSIRFKTRVRWSYIHCRGGCRDDNPKLNHSVISYTRGAYWTGTLVIFRKESSGIGPAIIRDIGLGDIPNVIRLLRQIGNGNQVRKNQVFKQTFNTTQCVIVRCKGDYENAPERTQLAVTRVPELHPIFEGQPTNVSQLMGIPLIIQRIPREAGKDVVFDEDHLRNDICGHLHLDTLLHSVTLGEIPPQWRENVGTVLVARQDRKDITPRQLMAIATYTKLSDLGEVKDEPDVRTRQILLEGYFSRSEFEQFFFNCFAYILTQQPQLDGELISPYSDSYDTSDISHYTSFTESDESGEGD